MLCVCYKCGGSTKKMMAYVPVQKVNGVRVTLAKPAFICEDCNKLFKEPSRK